MNVLFQRLYDLFPKQRNANISHYSGASLPDLQCFWAFNCIFRDDVFILYDLPGKSLKELRGCYYAIVHTDYAKAF